MTDKNNDNNNNNNTHARAYTRTHTSVLAKVSYRTSLDVAAAWEMKCERNSQNRRIAMLMATTLDGSRDGAIGTSCGADGHVRVTWRAGISANQKKTMPILPPPPPPPQGTS